jgi:SAM-dependent methyltransferase
MSDTALSSPSGGVRQALRPQDFFVPPLVDLGDTEPAFRGIFTPEPELGAEKLGVSDQFLANGADYHRKYSNAEYFLFLFNKVFRRTRKPQGSGLKIFDIGTGPGVNSIQPCLELFPDCKIVATDLSPQLLAILRDYVVASGLEDRVATVCTDAMRDYVKPGAFDMVVGTAILHHLFDPVVALKAARRALKPGGLAIFSEPFEGYVLLRVMFENILAHAERDETLEPKLTEATVTVMRTFISDFKLRSGRNKTDPVFNILDDKWLFTRNYFEEAAMLAGFKLLDIVSVHDHSRYLFREIVKSMLRLGAGVTPEEIPDWAWAHVDIFDDSISHDLKQDLVMEGMVVFQAP